MTAEGGRRARKMKHPHVGACRLDFCGYDRCPHCSFDPTSMNDYCDAHRPAAQPSESEREGAAVRRIQEPAGVRTACDGCSAESSDLIRISPTEGDPVHLCIGCAVQVATSVQDLVAPPSPPSTGQSREQGEVCKRCLEPVDVVWLAPDWLWEKARTSPDDLGHNVLCVRCFSLAAEGAGFPVWFEARRHAAEPCIPRKDVAVLDLCDIASRHRECGPYCADLRAEFAAALESKP
jgi:hypothetical protein